MMQRTAVLLLVLTASCGAVRHVKQRASLGLQPEVVANMLVKVEESWKNEAVTFLACNKTADGDCVGSVEAFEKSCNTVANAVMQASSGEKSVVKEYMSDVCGVGKLAGWQQVQCVGLAQAISDGMTASSYTNREDLDTAAICKKFWSVFVTAEADSEAKEEAKKAAEAKEAEAADAVREAEERKQVQEAAEKEAEEARVHAEEAAKVAKEHSADNVLAKSENSMKTATDSADQAKEHLAAVASQNQTVAATTEEAAPAANATVETAAAVEAPAVEPAVEAAPQNATTQNATAPAAEVEATPEVAKVDATAANTSATVEATATANATVNATVEAAPAPVQAAVENATATNGTNSTPSAI